MIRQIWNRLQLMYAVGTGTMIGSDKIQVSILDGEIADNVDRVEPYGFSYRPKKGCRAYMLFPSGDRTRGFALIVGDKRYQMDLAEGEVAVHDDAGNYMHMQHGGTIKVKASTKVLADTPMFETTQDCKIGGNLEVVGTSHLTQDVTCGANVIAVGNVSGAVVLAGGFSSLAGGAGVMAHGLQITGTFTVNGKSVDENHTHTSLVGGGVTSGVN
jgi:phage gp45-like